MIKHLVRILFSVLLLGYVGLKIDWQTMAAVFKGLNIGWYLLSTIIALSSAVFMAAKYHLLIRGTSLSLTVTRLLVIQYISRFYALLLPTALGPEAVRWYKVTRDKKGKSFFLAATAYERMLFLLTLLCCGMIPLLLSRNNPAILDLRDRLWPIAAVCGVALAAGIFYLLNGAIHRVVFSFLKKWLRTKKGGRLDLVLDNMVLKDRSMKLLIRLVFFTLCWQLFFIARIYFLFHSMGLSFDIIEAAWMGSLVMLLQVLPVSFAGLGIREGAYAYLFALYGLPAEQGVVIGLLFFTQMLSFAVIGSVLTFFEK